METGSYNGDKTTTELATNGPLVVETSRLNQLLDHIRSAAIQSKYLMKGRSSSVTHDSDDDSTDDDDDDERDELPVRLPWIHHSRKLHSIEMQLDPAIKIISTRSVRMKTQETSISASQSVYMGSLNLLVEQPWSSDTEQTLPQLRPPSHSDLRSAPHSELNKIGQVTMSD